MRTYVAQTRSVADFNQLPIPYRVVATDMLSGNMVTREQLIGPVRLISCSNDVPLPASRKRIRSGRITLFMAESGCRRLMCTTASTRSPRDSQPTPVPLRGRALS